MMNIDYIALGEELIENASSNICAEEVRDFFQHKQETQDSKVVKLGSNNNNTESSFDWDIRKALFDVINDKEFPIADYSKMVLFQLDDSSDNDRYKVRYINVGMRSAEAISLVEVGKSILLETMGY